MNLKESQNAQAGAHPHGGTASPPVSVAASRTSPPISGASRTSNAVASGGGAAAGRAKPSSDPLLALMMQRDALASPLVSVASRTSSNASRSRDHSREYSRGGETSRDVVQEGSGGGENSREYWVSLVGEAGRQEKSPWSHSMSGSGDAAQNKSRAKPSSDPLLALMMQRDALAGAEPGSRQASPEPNRTLDGSNVMRMAPTSPMRGSGDGVQEKERLQAILARLEAEKGSKGSPGPNGSNDSSFVSGQTTFVSGHTTYDRNRGGVGGRQRSPPEPRLQNRTSNGSSVMRMAPTSPEETESQPPKPYTLNPKP